MSCVWQLFIKRIYDDDDDDDDDAGSWGQASKFLTKGWKTYLSGRSTSSEGFADKKRTCREIFNSLVSFVLYSRGLEGNNNNNAHSHNDLRDMRPSCCLKINAHPLIDSDT